MVARRADGCRIVITLCDGKLSWRGTFRSEYVQVLAVFHLQTAREDQFVVIAQYEIGIIMYLDSLAIRLRIIH